MGRVSIDVTGALRARVQAAVRERVAGDDHGVRERRVWGTPGERWFTPADPIWAVHSDPAIFVGGIRALLVQSLHPLAMAGVAGHSGFRGDPWGRLHRTSDYVATTTYAPVPDAERLIGAIRSIHARVSGHAPDGRAYAASDPHLLAWVHAAEAESFLAAHQAFAARPLSLADADTYVAQIGQVAQRLGVPHAPTTVAELEATLTAYRPELALTEAAADTREFLLHEAPLPRSQRGPYAALAGGAVATLPGWARALLGLERSALTDRAARTAARLTTRALRWGTDHPAHRGQWEAAWRAAHP